MPAALGAAGHQHVHPVLDRADGVRHGGDLRRDGHPGVMRFPHPGPFITEADAQQRRPGGQCHFQQVRLFAHHPVHQSDAERATEVAQFGQFPAQRDPGWPHLPIPIMPSPPARDTAAASRPRPRHPSAHSAREPGDPLRQTRW